MGILEIGKRKNITQMVLNLVKKHFQDETSPLTITNKELPLIEESAYVIAALEEAGYKVKTFKSDDKYGIEVSK